MSVISMDEIHKGVSLNKMIKGTFLDERPEGAVLVIPKWFITVIGLLVIVCSFVGGVSSVYATMRNDISYIKEQIQYTQENNAEFEDRIDNCEVQLSHLDEMQDNIKEIKADIKDILKNR